MDAPSTKKYCNRETQRKRSHACDMTFGRSRAKSHEIHVDTGESKCRRGDPWKAPSECPQHVISLALGPGYFRPGHKVSQVLQILCMHCPKRMQNNAEKPIPSTGGKNRAKSERRFCARVPGRTSRKHFRMLRCSLLCNVPSADPDIQNRASTIEIALQQSKSRFNTRHRNSMCGNRISTCKKGSSTCEKRI